jgi:Ribbon-helix-helix protein, copG family
VKRTTVKLPDELDARLRHVAKRRGITVSQLTREAIEEKLGVGKRRRFLSVGAGRSGDGNIAARIEELLAEDARTGKYPPPFRS